MSEKKRKWDIGAKNSLTNNCKKKIGYYQESFSTEIMLEMDIC